MTHLILHSQVVHPYNERIWPPLWAMYDLALLQRPLGSSIDWPRIERRFRDNRQYGALALHLLQVRDALGLETPIAIRLTGLTRLRWLRRKLLGRWPTPRYLDRLYMFSMICIRRLRVLHNVLCTPGGIGHLLKQLLEPDVYVRLLTDLIEGRSR